MNKKTEMNEEIYKYIADFIDCTIEQLKSDDTYFVKSRKKDYIKILSIRDANIISLSENQYEIGKQFGAVICLFGQTHMEFDNKKMKL